MTAPTTPAQLLDLAAGELAQLAAADPAPFSQIAAAWPAFQRSGDRILAALQPDAGALDPQPPSAAPAGIPDLSLERAALLVGAAADLLSTEARQDLPPEVVATDTELAARLLLSASWMVQQRAAGHPEQAALAGQPAQHRWGGSRRCPPSRHCTPSRRP